MELAGLNPKREGQCGVDGVAKAKLPEFTIPTDVASSSFHFDVSICCAF